jgi:MFS family permease
VTKSRKAGLLIIFVTVFIDLLGFGIVLPLLPRYGKFFDANGWTLGLLMSSFSAMQFLFAPIWGRVSDRIGRRPILILGLAGSTISYAMFGAAIQFAGTPMMLGLSVLTWLFITRIGAGIAGATISTAQAYIADVTGKTERAKGMALIGAAFGIGFTFGPLIGAAFVSDGSGDSLSAAPGYVAAVLSGLALLSAIFMLPESLKANSAPAHHHWLDFSSLRDAFSRPSIGMILGTMFLTTFAFAQFEATLSVLTKQLGLNAQHNFYVFAYVGMVLTLTQGLLVRRLLPKLGEFRMALAGAVLMVVGLALTAVAGTYQSLGILYAVLPINVVGFSAMSPSLLAMLSLRSESSAQGGILGLGQSMSALARILGPLVAFPLFEMELTYPYYSGAALMAVGAMLVLTLRSTKADAGAAPNEA